MVYLNLLSVLLKQSVSQMSCVIFVSYCKIGYTCTTIRAEQVISCKTERMKDNVCINAHQSNQNDTYIT